MATLPATKQRLTLDDYARIEAESDVKHEFYDGEVFAMAGGTARHARLCVNVVRRLDEALEGKPCYTFSSEMRVRSLADAPDASDLDTYPDASVVCGTPQFAPPADTLLNPTVLVEVLSAKTESYDRGAKFRLYRRIASLKEYVLVTPSRTLVEVFRKEGGHWVLYEFAEGAVELDSLGVSLALDTLYADVDLDPDPPLHTPEPDA